MLPPARLVALGRTACPAPRIRMPLDSVREIILSLRPEFRPQVNRRVISSLPFTCDQFYDMAEV